MTASSRRVVITGVGVISPIGLDVASYWKSLLAGTGGVRPIRAFDCSALPVRIAGEVPEFEAKKYVDKKAQRSLKVMARTIQLGVAAAQLALDDGKVDKSKLDPARFGVEFGSGLIATELPEIADAARLSTNCQPGVVDLEKWGSVGIEAIQPLWMLKYLPNLPACHISILHNAQGPNNSITECDVASLLAIGEAFRVLSRDGADFFLVGGAESKVNPLSLVRQCLFEPLSRNNEAPLAACRPFDRRRDGIVLGEGAAVMVMEDLEHARQRGARVYAEVVGFGAAFDLRRNGAGLARALRSALAEAGITSADVDHVNAHGLATRESDLWEAKALREVFGPDMPVVAYKGYFGNHGAGAGTLEATASLLALRDGTVAGSLNHDEADPECGVAMLTAPRPLVKDHVVKLGFTQAGQCGAVVLRRWRE